MSLPPEVSDPDSEPDSDPASDDWFFRQQDVFPQILDAITDLVLVKGERSRILWANRAFRDYYGMSNEQLRDLIDAPFNERDFTSKYLRDDLRVFATGEVLDIPEEPVTRQDGAIHVFHTVKSPIRDSSGQVRMTVGVSRNMTAQKRAQEELERYRQHLEKLVGERTEQIKSLSDRLQIILASLAEGIVALDGVGRVRLLNPAAETLTGFTTDEAKGRDLAALLDFTPDAAGPSLGVALASNLAISGHLRVRGGRVHLVSIKGSPLIGPSEARVGSVVMIRDIGLEREVEDQRLRYQKLESVGLLAGGLAHDFNNIVMGILGSISVARQTLKQGGDAGALLDEAERACLRTRGLTTQLLTFAKGGAPVKKIMRIEGTIREAVELALRGSRVELSWYCAPDVHPAEVDDGQLSQVFNNLALNAKQAMPPGEGGRLLVSIENLMLAEGRALPLAAGAYILISVKDSGVGIPPENLPRVFDPYFTTRDNGTGLGLASVHSIIRQHGGHVTVSSAPGDGACFRVYLPGARLSETAPSSANLGVVRGRVRNILVVDDDATVRRVMQAMLGHLGHRVTAADGSTTARDAFERARTDGDPFDAVFVDLTMPGDLGGIGIATCLREQEAEVRLVVMSGYSVDPVMANPIARGFRAALPKPFTIEALKQALDCCL